jgi:hypothetical protein
MAYNVNGRYDQGDVYNRVKRAGVITTQSYLRFEKSIQGTFNSISFDVLTNQGAASTTERRLQLTDTFTITQLAIFIYQAGTTTTVTNQDKAKALLYANPNPNVFVQSTADSLYNVYNGYMQLRVNTEVLIDSLDIMQFYRVHTTQNGAVTNATEEWNAINNGFKKIVPTITLNGAAKNEINLFFPESIDLTGDEKSNYIVCYCRGFLNQNAAQLNPGL